MTLTPRRRALLDAAIEVLADRGLRGLTHRAVDRQAGVPEGTSSAYFRTRGALQGAVALRVTTVLREDVEELAVQLADAPGDHAQAVRLTAALFESWLERGGALAARLELTLEARRDPEIAATLLSGRERLIHVVTGVMEVVHGAEQEARATTLVAALDGVLLAAFLLRENERTAFLRASLDMLIDAPPEQA